MARTPTTIRMKQLVDWSASIWAGLIAGAGFFLLNIFVTPLVNGGGPWTFVRMFASILLGEDVLIEQAGQSNVTLVLAALGIHFLLSIGFAMIIAYVIHRGGLLTGILGGALLGLMLYAINFYSMTLFFPWFYAFKNSVLIGSHVVFGAMAGGIYEALEVEEFVPVEEADGEEVTS